MLESVWQDLRYAARALWRTPSFTLTAVLSLGLGIGGNAAIFSLADALLFRTPAGVRAPERLVDVGRTEDGEGFDTLSHPTYLDLRARARTLEALAAYRAESDAVGLDAGQGAERAYATAASGNYFSVLGVAMHLGRGFAPADDHLDSSPVVVLTHTLWQTRFQADPGIVGRSVRLNGRAFTVVGVAAEGFAGHTVATTDLWVPLSIHRGVLVAGRPQDLTARYATWLLGIGRLAPGVTVAQARAEIVTIGRQLEAQFPSARAAGGATVLPARVIPFDVDVIPRFVLLLFLLVGLILLIACANVGGMLLARGAARSREMAVRTSLGSSRGRVLRLLVTESLVLSGLGAAAGVIISLALVRLMRGIVPVFPIPVVIDFAVDWRVAGFCAALSVVTGVVCGLLPSMATSRSSLLVSARAEPAGGRRLGLRHAFVMVQVTTSVLLVVTALLLGRSLANAVNVDPGFTVDGVDVASLDLRLAGYDEARGVRFAEALLARLRATPGIAEVSTARMVPLSGTGLSLGEIRPAGQARDARPIPARWNVVSPRFFETLRLPMTRGRTFDDRDGRDRPVAIVNETFAHRTWPDGDALGQTLRHTSYDENGRVIGERLLEVIGVARDARNASLSEAPAPFIYVTLQQYYDPRMWMVIRRTGATAVPALRRVLREMDPGLPIVEASSLRQASQFTLVLQRGAAWVAGGVGIVGLLLAAVGIYGITAFHVVRRTREIGIRIALGALRAQVVGMVVRQAVTVAALGALAGLMLAGVAAQFLTALLYGIAPLDPVSFAGGAALFAALALMASLIPARRAASVNPVTAIRSE